MLVRTCARAEKARRRSASQLKNEAGYGPRIVRVEYGWKEPDNDKKGRITVDAAPKISFHTSFKKQINTKPFKSILQNVLIICNYRENFIKSCNTLKSNKKIPLKILNNNFDSVIEMLLNK